MEAFFEIASTWTREMRLSIEKRDTDALRALVDRYGEIEVEAIAAVRRLQSAEPLALEQRERLVRELRELERAGQIVAALTESESLYLAWGQQGTQPPREYTSSGKVPVPERPSAHWEA